MRFAVRYAILVPIAYCIYVAIASNDMNARFFAMLALIILSQVRDWSLLETAREVAKHNKP